MIYFFEFIGGLTFWLIYALWKDVNKRRWKAAEDKAKSKDEEVFAAFQEMREFEECVRAESRDALILDVNDEMTELFGGNWKDKFNWNNYVSLGPGHDLNIHIGWESVACLYFAKRGKIVAHSYEFISKRQDDIITLYKRVEKHIRKTHSSMSLIFVPQMDVEFIDGKRVYRESRFGSGKLMWEYHYEQFLRDPARNLTRRLW